jgi:hypothetical protein
MKVLAISDLQAPFQHKDALKFLQTVAYEKQTNAWVCMGDEVDFHALSDYDHNPNGYSAGHELEAALRFMRLLYAAFPTVKSCISNHTMRPLRRALRAGIPTAFIRKYKEFLEAPEGWTWHEKIEIDGIIYEHGDECAGSSPNVLEKIARLNNKPTVVGHHHSKPGVLHYKPGLWAMNAGCLIDRTAYAFSYMRNKSKIVPGTGVVIDGDPSFIRMKLNKSGTRWTGKL